MRLLRILGLCALVILCVGASLLVTGFNESSRRGMERQNGVRSIPGDSPFVRATLAGRLGDDFASVSKVGEILALAGRSADVTALQTFFIDCNARRLTGSDDACRQETVASAIEKGRTLGRAAPPVAAPPALEARFADAVSFFLPDEQALRASAEENSWRNLRYEGPGVLRYDAPAKGIYMFVAARNHSEWPIRSIQGVLTLRLPSGAGLELECSSHNPFPFSSRGMQPGGETTAACRRPDNVSIEDLASAMQALATETPAVRLAEFEVRSPYVAIADRGASASPRFTVAGISNLFFAGREEIFVANEPGLKRQLVDMDCRELGNCPSAYEALAMFVSSPFLNHVLLIPTMLGVLLGVTIGGLVRRSLVFGGAFAALLVLLAVGGVFLLFQSVSSGGGENGFALMGIAALTYGAGAAFVVGLPAFFLTIAVMRALRSRLEPTSATAQPR